MGKRVTTILLLALILSACQNTPVVPTPVGTVTRPDLVTLINWERSPLAVVFRAEAATTDTTSFERRGDIADCTVFGDNRVVYTAPNGIGFGVNWQTVSDEAIRVFVEDLTLNYKIYDRSAGLDALPLEERPVQTESLTLVVNGQAHRADALGGWPDDYYRAVTERCRAVADAPAELIPAGAYVSAQTTTFSDSQASINWDAASGLDLSTLTEDRKWLTGAPVQAIWVAQRTSGANVQIQQGDTVYRLAVEVPGVTRFSPPPP